MIDLSLFEGHTPPPWQASHDRLEHGCVVNSYGWRVYVGEHEKRAEIQNDTFDHDELSEPNARLIAAAPELALEVKELRAWKKLVSDIVQQHDGPHLREMLKEMIDSSNTVEGED